MPRYFIEVSYNGTAYAGFQIQANASTIQEVVENALKIYFKFPIHLTGSSRTDAGVHAHQNYFHANINIDNISQKVLYGLNAILPVDIVVKSIAKVLPTAHSRFDAVCRSYQYYVYQTKNPFVKNDAYFFPFKIDKALLHETASIILNYTDFSAFSKKHTQVNNNICTIHKSYWEEHNGFLIYNVSGNRFLRGMVRALVATSLKVATKNISIAQFISICEGKKLASAYFNAPAMGLFLHEVVFDEKVYDIH